MALRCDYDDDPGRFRLARSIVAKYGAGEDIHRRVAERLLADDRLPVLDVGCGEGELARHVPEGAWAGADSSQTMLGVAPIGARLGDAAALPFPDESFASVALLYVLYHLDDPERALAEAHRVLRRGGLVVAAAPSRYDSPELARWLPQPELTFDAESAKPLLEGLFEDVEIECWDAPLLRLPTAPAVRDYLLGRGLSPADAERAAAAARLPLMVTKRGAIAYGLKGSTRAGVPG